MPFIDTKITIKLNPDKKEKLKEEFGKAITALNKTETYLMVGIDDNYELWLGGKRLEKGANVSVSLYGSSSAENYNKMTGLICDILEAELGIPGNAVYVTYHPVKDWGWNGSNF